MFSTGHHAASHNESQLPQIEDVTRIVYMPGRDLRTLAAQWLAEGLPADFPCAVISRAAQPDQEIFQTTLGELGHAAPAAAPSILLAGWAIRDAAAAAASARETIAASA
jgi:siroheme synthase